MTPTPTPPRPMPAPTPTPPATIDQPWWPWEEGGGPPANPNEGNNAQYEAPLTPRQSPSTQLDPLANAIGDTDTISDEPPLTGPNRLSPPFGPPPSWWQQSYIERFTRKYNDAPTAEELDYAWRYEGEKWLQNQQPRDLNGDQVQV